MWQYKNKNLEEKDISNSAVGFIYLITNLTNNKKYIGKKLLTKASYKTVNGKKKKCRKESDWKDYWSSSDILKEDVLLLGEDNFKREIICFCFSLSVLNYSEQKVQFALSVLEKIDWYNANINAKIFKGNVYDKVSNDLNMFIKQSL